MPAFASTFRPGLFRTRDAGRSWEPVQGGLPTEDVVVGLAIAPSDPQTLYVSILNRGVFRSRDGGNSWVPAGNPVPEGVGISDLAVHPRSPLTVYGAGLDIGVFRTTEGGRRWTLTAPPPSRSRFVVVLALDASAALYAGTSALQGDVGGVLLSVDGGASWERRNQGIPGLAALSVAVDPAGPDNLVAAVSGPGLFRTANAAARWVPVRSGFPPPRIPGVLTRGSTDFGETWQELSGRLALETFGFAFGPDRVYAATTNGVWVLEEAD